MRKASPPAGLPNLGLLVAFFFGTLVGALLAGVGTGSAGIVESDRLRIAREPPANSLLNTHTHTYTTSNLQLAT